MVSGFLVSFLTHTEPTSASSLALQHTSLKQKGGAPHFFLPSSGWHGTGAWIIHLASRKESMESQTHHYFS